MKPLQDPRTGAMSTADATGKGGGAGGPGGPEPPGDLAAAGGAGGEQRPGGHGGALFRLERRYRFSASHLYRRPEWSDEENRAHFGKCSNIPGHGHNYRLFVTVRGPLAPLTSFVVDLGQLDALVTLLVLERLDHQHLNTAVPEFAVGGVNPSSEALVRWVHDQLAPALPSGVALARLRLEEDEDLAAEWHPEDGWMAEDA